MFSGVGPGGTNGTFSNTPAQIPPNYPRHSMLRMSVQPPISTIACKILYSLANPMLLFPMLATLRPEASASSPEPRSPASLPRATERGRRDNFPSLSPFPATLTRPLQLAENPATLSPFAATLTSSVKHNSFVCHSCRKHPGWGHIFQSKFVSFRNLTTHHSLLSAISFIIRTYEKTGGGGAPF